MIHGRYLSLWWTQNDWIGNVEYTLVKPYLCRIHYKKKYIQLLGWTKYKFIKTFYRLSPFIVNQAINCVNTAKHWLLPKSNSVYYNMAKQVKLITSARRETRETKYNQKLQNRHTVVMMWWRHFRFWQSTHWKTQIQITIINYIFCRWKQKIEYLSAYEERLEILYACLSRLTFVNYSRLERISHNLCANAHGYH